MHRIKKMEGKLNSGDLMLVQGQIPGIFLLDVYDSARI